MIPTNIIEAWLYAELNRLIPEAEGRIAPDAMDKGTEVPCVVYQLTEGEPERLLDCGPSGLGVLGYQIRIYTAKRKAGNSLRENLGAAMENRAGVSLVDGVSIDTTEFAGLQNTYDPDTREYGALCAVRIHWVKE